jgi:hypothetical protein
MLTRDKKQRKPRAEWRDFPWRYLVRGESAARSGESRAQALAGVSPDAVCRLMGTDETVEHARQRLGWV